MAQRATVDGDDGDGRHVAAAVSSRQRSATRCGDE
jgi:hypothetical protein